MGVDCKYKRAAYSSALSVCIGTVVQFVIVRYLGGDIAIVLGLKSLVTLAAWFAMALMLDYLIRVKHISASSAATLRGAIAVAGRVAALLTFFDIPHAIAQDRSLGVILGARVFDFASMTTLVFSLSCMLDA